MAKRPVPKYDFKAFGAAIKAARTGRKESRKKVSDEMYISPRYLANIENNGQHPIGIRPAIGYPSLPDQSLIFDIDRLMPLSPTGISLTENGAMSPAASTCGLIIAHPQSRYFVIGAIGDDQRSDYAARRGLSPSDLAKWLR